MVKAIIEQTVVYPDHWFQPEDLVGFVQSTAFTKRWDSYSLVDEDLQALEIMVMMNPKGPPVIPGTGGLRKMRFSPARDNSGKRGSMRVCYVFYEEYHIVNLLMIYKKSERDDLTDREKFAIRELIRSTTARLADGDRV